MNNLLRDMRTVLNQSNAQEAFQAFVKEKNGKESY